MWRSAPNVRRADKHGDRVRQRSHARNATQLRPTINIRVLDACRILRDITACERSSNGEFAEYCRNKRKAHEGCAPHGTPASGPTGLVSSGSVRPEQALLGLNG